VVNRKNDAQSKDRTRITIRFRDEAVAEEFHRQASAVDKKASPFAAELIEQALTSSDSEEFEAGLLRNEIQELRIAVQKLSGRNGEGNDDFLRDEISHLRNDLVELIGSVKLLEDLSRKTTKLHSLYQKIQGDVAQLANWDQGLLKLREDNASGMFLLLVRACGLTPEDAEEWIRKTLLEE
jgi:hypothetical protein